MLTVIAGVETNITYLSLDTLFVLNYELSFTSIYKMCFHLKIIVYFCALVCAFCCEMVFICRLSCQISSSVKIFFHAGITLPPPIIRMAIKPSGLLFNKRKLAGLVASAKAAGPSPRPSTPWHIWQCCSKIAFPAAATSGVLCKEFAVIDIFTGLFGKHAASVNMIAMALAERAWYKADWEADKPNAQKRLND